MQQATQQNLALDCGAATRAHPLMAVNGDAFVLKQWEAGALVGVIDGLGHGPDAQHAAQTARHAVESHYDQSLETLFREVGRACRTTRGVVMALARFVLRPVSAVDSLTFASIGNIEARLFGSAFPVNFQVRRGIIGVHALTPALTEQCWESGHMLVLHSDGVSTRWGWQDCARLGLTSATLTAQHLLQTLAVDHDDATVVVVKGQAKVSHSHEQ